MANTLNIKVENEHVLTESILPGFDKNNVIGSSSSSIVATEDCFCVCSATNSSGSAWATVDGIYIMNSSGQDRWFNHVSNAPVKKGQTVSIGAGYGTPSITLYGIKR